MGPDPRPLFCTFSEKKKTIPCLNDLLRKKPLKVIILTKLPELTVQSSNFEKDQQTPALKTYKIQTWAAAVYPQPRLLHKKHANIIKLLAVKS
jgi:hypothetical protein